LIPKQNLLENPSSIFYCPNEGSILRVTGKKKRKKAEKTGFGLTEEKKSIRSRKEDRIEEKQGISSRLIGSLSIDFDQIQQQVKHKMKF